MKKLNYYGTFLAFLTCMASTAVAQTTEQSIIEVKGAGIPSIRLSAADLQQMPHISLTNPGKDGAPRVYQGVPLAHILEMAGVSADKMGAKGIAKRYLAVRASDGFEVVFALAEIDPVFSGEKIILADQLDGKPLPAEKGPFQVVVEKDLKPTRHIYKVTSLSVDSTETKN